MSLEENFQAMKVQLFKIVVKTSEGFVGEICFHEANKQENNSFAPSNLWKATFTDQLVMLNLLSFGMPDRHLTHFLSLQW
jgi:hypothetical protein